MLLLTSIPHSGTLFFAGVLKPDQQAHFTSPEIKRFFKESTTVACAVRHPRLIWRSWFNRSKHKDGKPNAHWHNGWRTFRLLAKEYPDIYYLPIDHEDKGVYLDILASRLGRLFLPNWEKKENAYENGPLHDPPEIDMSIPFSIPIIQELYG